MTWLLARGRLPNTHRTSESKKEHMSRDERKNRNEKQREK